MILEHDKPKDLRAETVTLIYLLTRYVQDYAKDLAAGLPIKYAMQNVMEYMPTTTLKEFSEPEVQLKFIKAMEASGKSGPTIERRLTVIIAAINYAADTSKIIPKSAVPDSYKRPKKTVRVGVRRFTMEEMRKVFEAASTDSERLALLFWTLTLCRPGQLLDLTHDRLDFEEGTIDFNVPGMEITNKRRAMVYMIPTFRRFLETRKGNGLVIVNSRNGEPLKGFKHRMRALCKRAGINGSAYRIRKFSNSYLANEGIPTVQLEAMLAHKFGGAGQISRYTEADLPKVVVKLEQMLKEIGPSWLHEAIGSELGVANAKPLILKVGASTPV